MIEMIAGRTEVDQFTEMLNRVCLIDIGTIIKYDQQTGKGDVNLYMIRQGVQKKLTNIEILSIGNSAYRSPISSGRFNEVKLPHVR